MTALALAAIAWYLIPGLNRAGSPKTGWRLVARYSLWCATCWLHVLVVFVQDGYYEGAIVMSVIVVVVGVETAALSGLVFLKPLYSMRPALRDQLRRLERRSRVFSVVLWSMFGLPHLVGLRYVRDENPADYNAAMLASICSLGFIVTVIAALPTYALSKFKRALHALDTHASVTVVSHDGLKDMLDRVNSGMRMTMLFAFMDGLVMAIVCAVWGVLGSFPYLFVVWMGAFSVVALNTPLLIRFTTSRLERANGPFASTSSGLAHSNNNNNVAFAGALLA
jgi:hypothetical protein